MKHIEHEAFQNHDIFIDIEVENLQFDIISKGFNDFLTEISQDKITHKYYDDTVEHAEEMGVHVEGFKPEKLLKINRPSERPEIQEYRLAIWQAVTEGLSEKVINTLNRIYNERFFKIIFPDKPTTSLIDEDEDLKTYITEGIPEYGSLMTYIRETFTKKNLSDANAAIVVMPTKFNIEQGELLEPESIFYDSKSLRIFKDENWYFFLVDEKIFIVSKTHIFWLIQTEDAKEVTWNVAFQWAHNIGVPPVFRTGGIVSGVKSPYWFKSFIGGVLPHWNRVVTLSSDLDGNYNSHMHLERWSFANECTADGCRNGLVNNPIDFQGELQNNFTECIRCKGTGKEGRSPYNETFINRDGLDPEAPLPIPPFGYPAKPTEIVGIIEDRIKQEKEDGLASINFDILNKVGENQSGVAKVLDRQDMDSFLQRYADHVFVDIIPQTIFYMAAWRYGVLLRGSDEGLINEEAIRNLLPEVVSPKNFNVLSLDMLQAMLKEASTANVSDSMLKHLERDIAVKQFVNDEDKKVRELLIIDLQPFPGKSVDDLLSLQGLTIKDWEIFKSLKIGELVDKAIEDNPEFIDLPRKEQRQIIDDMAMEARPTDQQLIATPIIEDDGA